MLARPVGAITVEVVSSEETASLCIRLGAELRIAGFHVTATTAPDRLPSHWIEERLAAAWALVYVDPASDRVEVHYHRRDTVVRLTVPLPPSGDGEQATALHIAEVLRVAAPTAARRPPDPEPGPPRRQQSTVARPQVAPRLAGFIDAALTLPTLAAPPAAGLHLGLGVHWTPLWRTVLIAAIPITAVPIDGEYGRITVHAGYLGAVAGVTANGRRCAPVLRLGYLVWLFRATATPRRDVVGKSDTTVSAGPYASMGLAIFLGHRIGLELGAAAAAIRTRVVYTAADKPVAQVGRPIFEFTAGIHLLPPRRPR